MAGGDLRSIMLAAVRGGTHRTYTPDKALLEAVWTDKPVTLRVFVESPDHMNLPPLSEAQYQELEAVIGTDPTKMFEPDRIVRLGVFLWGKGSGKDYICSIVVGYGIHVLLCLRDPMAYLNPIVNSTKGVVGEDLDIINVAYNEKQASGVFFEKLKSRVRHWPWLAGRFSIYEDNKLISPSGQPRVYITDREVTFPVRRFNHKLGRQEEIYRIRALSENSSNESYEGHNVIMWIMDEASAFASSEGKSNAHAIYGTLRTSADSRFPKRWTGFILSYPRHAEDFTMEMYAQSLEDPTIHGSIKAPWEVNPTKKESDFEAEKRTNPEEYNAKYLCRPPKVVDGFFKQPERIYGCVDSTIIPLFKAADQLLQHEVKLQDGTTKISEFIGQVIESFRPMTLAEKAIHRVIWIDGALSSDRACLMVGHGESVTMQIADEQQIVHDIDMLAPIMDAIVWWEPDPTRKLLISLQSIESMVMELINAGIPIDAIGFDQFTTHLVESLTSKGIFVEKHSIDTEDYESLRKMVYSGTPRLINDPLLLYEIEHLMLIKGKRVDHPEEAFHQFGRGGSRKKQKGSKDGADCLAGINRLLNGDRAVSARPSVQPSFPRSVPIFGGSGPVNRDAPLRSMPGGQVGQQQVFSPQALQAIANQGRGSAYSAGGIRVAPLSGPGAKLPPRNQDPRQHRARPPMRTFPQSRPGPT